MKTVIIGGVAGGASTATRLRRMDEKAEILILERGDFVSFANCGLPYHIGGVIQERDKLLVTTPEQLKTTFNIEARVKHEALAIDPQKKTVSVRDLSNGREYTEKYDKLVLSPGASPIIPPVPGVDLPGVFTLRSMPDMDRINDFISERRPPAQSWWAADSSGWKIAENLQNAAWKVTIIEMLNQ
jgi:Uncharacterized NAD(FAD)-dependent dehydrogenases